MHDMMKGPQDCSRFLDPHYNIDIVSLKNEIDKILCWTKQSQIKQKKRHTSQGNGRKCNQLETT